MVGNKTEQNKILRRNAFIMFENKKNNIRNH